MNFLRWGTLIQGGYILAQICLLLLPANCQNPGWLIDLVPQSTNNASTAPTWLNQAQGGESWLTVATGLPNTNGDLFVVSNYDKANLVTNVLFFLRTGEKVYQTSTSIYGVIFSIVKTQGTSLWLIWSTYGAAVVANAKSLIIQPLTVSGNAFSSSGTTITKTDQRVMTVVDKPGTIYFWGICEQTVLRYSAVDGTYTSSATIGSTQSTTMVNLDLPGLNAVCTWFMQTSIFALFDSTSLSTIKTQNMPTDLLLWSILDQTSPSVVWNTLSVSGLYTYIQKRSITPAAASPLATLVTSATQYQFYACNLLQLGTIGFLVVVPSHRDTRTVSASQGVIYFLRVTNIDNVIAYQTPSYARLYVQMCSRGFSNPSIDSGRDYFFSILDGSSSNLQTFYLQIDTCMNVDDYSLTCTNCPTGSYRLSTDFPAPRTCVKPSAFPVQTGMKNSTLTCEYCLVSNCGTCTYDYASCTACRSGYFLSTVSNPPTCQQPTQAPAGYGVDNNQKTVRPCNDPNCKNCQLDYKTCTVCDTANQWYLLGNTCIQPSSMSDYTLGADLVSGSYRACSGSGCLDCRQDYSKCQRCDYPTWLIDPVDNTCKQESTFGPRQGRNNVAQQVSFCKDPRCSVCKLDYRVCTTCTDATDSLVSGVCTIIAATSPVVPTSAPIPTSTSTPSANTAAVVQHAVSRQAFNFLRSRYSVAESTGTVEFPATIRLDYQGYFTDAFLVTVTDYESQNIYTCREPFAENPSVKCTAAVDRNMLKIKLSSDFSIVVARMQIRPRTPITTEIAPSISDSSTGATYNKYPIDIDGVSTDQDSTMSFFSNALGEASKVRPITSLLVAAMGLSISVLLDKFLNNLEYLSVFEGRILVFPEQIFDVVSSSSAFLPSQLITLPDWWFALSDMSDCQPTPAFLRQGYDCSLLATLGPDFYANCLIAVSTLAVSLLASKLIDIRTNYLIKQQPAVRLPTLNRGRLAKKLPTLSPDSSPFSKSSTALINSNRSEKSDLALRNDVGFLPSGKITPLAAQDKLVRVAVFTRETYGIGFFLVKLEASQLNFISAALLNFWNMNEGYLEQYSLIAAIIFTLYYIFQGYFTYQFASYIWKEVSKLKRESEIGDKEFLSSSGAESDSLPSKTKHALAEKLAHVFESPNKDIRTYFFETCCVPENFCQLCPPVVAMLRSWLGAFIVVVLATAPLAQVILAFIVEIGYLVFITKYTRTMEQAELNASIVGHVLICIYLVMKSFTVGKQLSESNCQRIGYYMAWVLLVYVGIGLIFMIYVIGHWIKDRVKLCRAPAIAPGIQKPEGIDPNFQKATIVDQNSSPFQRKVSQPQITTNKGRFSISPRKLMSPKFWAATPPQNALRKTKLETATVIPASPSKKQFVNLMQT